MGRSTASLITTVAPASVQPSTQAPTGRKRKRTNAEEDCDAAPSSGAPKSSTSNRKRKRVKKAVPAKASSLPAVAKAPSPELPPRDTSNSITKNVETLAAHRDHGGILLQDPLASLSERDLPEPSVVKPTGLDATPSTETVVPSIAKRPQSTTPPVVAASLDFIVGMPLSVEREDDLCDLFGDPLDDDSVSMGK
ncbi:uncharacterized protein B0H18DRAFT_1210597 [Fomitopsis serialis]|uniref:uncharacterized protein n=1 Tax=Fomitopsis serialis TaxID=139415 RepID=UPI0020086BE9|nr:uncharacterized protein B0H18DRAFT_1210597 [Neoantrodia serialis]KAH9927611.1 hypothetical protein B0H18DRAFT_1210597 [Neoantrodia serialis]